MRIDFVSDIACPWCALGVASLEQALQQLGNGFKYELHFQPFELNPDMPKEGRNLVEYLSQKYGMTADRIQASHDALHERGLEVGFVFGHREQIWNTLEAHRLLYWADQSATPDSQFMLKKALLRAYHSEGKDPGDPQLLINLVDETGLDIDEAKSILSSDKFTQEVRALEQQWQRAGISAVPSMVINQRHLLQGAQPVAIVTQTLRQLEAST